MELQKLGITINDQTVEIDVVGDRIIIRDDIYNTLEENGEDLSDVISCSQVTKKTIKALKVLNKLQKKVLRTSTSE